jgi:hypothetical protein
MHFEEILLLIENDELEKAIEALKQANAGTPKFKDTILVAAWLKEFRGNANVGVLSYDQQVQEKNRIRRSLLELLPDEQPAEKKPPVPTLPNGNNISGQQFFKTHVKQVKIKFFESGQPCPPIAERKYGKAFPKAQAKTIWWEIEIICLPSDEPVQFDLTFFFYDSAGNIMGNKGYTAPMEFPKKQTVWIYWWGWGFQEAGKWAPGSYKADIYADDVQLVSGIFEITA